VPVRSNLQPYECAGFTWDTDQLHCINCRAPLKELPLQTAALPNLVGELRERYESSVGYEGGGHTVRKVRVTEVVPKRRITDDSDLEEMLGALRDAVVQAMNEAEVVELS